MIKQISVFLENKEGRLAEVTRTLADNCINIRAMSIADTTDFGILRLIVDDPQKAQKVLESAQFTVKIKEVLAVGINDQPGALAKVLDILLEADITIEYMYAFLGKCKDMALVILKLSDNDRAAASFSQQNVSVIAEEELYNL